MERIERILILTEKDLKIIIIGTIVSGIVQYVCWKFVTNNPELFENLDDDEFVKEIAEEIRKETSKTQKFFKRIRGGGFPKRIAQKTMVELLLRIAKRCAKNGLRDSILALITFVVVEKIPKKKVISTILRYAGKKLTDGSPITYTKWNAYLRTTEMKPLSECEPGWTFILEVLLNKDLPYSVREEKVKSFFRHQLSFQTKGDLVRFVACIVAIIVLFVGLGDTSSSFIVMQNLLEALKRGKISREVAKIIVRRLKRKGILIDPELLEAVAN